MSDDFFRKCLMAILITAIQTDSSYYSYDGFQVDKEFARALDELTGQLFDLVDEHLNARDIGDIASSNKILDKILSDGVLRLLSSYWLDSSVKDVEPSGVMVWL